MTISARNWAWALNRMKDGEVTTFKEKITLLYLAERESAEYGFAFPSHENIARRTGQSVRTVQSHLRELEAIGTVVITKRKRESGRFLRNVYYLQVPDSYRESDKEWQRLQC